MKWNVPDKIDTETLVQSRHKQDTASSIFFRRLYKRLRSNLTRTISGEPLVAVTWLRQIQDENIIMRLRDLKNPVSGWRLKVH